MSSNNEAFSHSESERRQPPEGTRVDDNGQGNSVLPNAHHDVIANARSAAAKEQRMTLWQGLKLYPKAVCWSLLISTCIVMEGYDISLVNNFCEFMFSWICARSCLRYNEHMAKH